MNKLRLIYASSLSAALTALFVTLITIKAELNAPLKAWLAGLSGHHWTSKSILSLALYVAALFLCYMLFRNVDAEKVRRGISLAVWSAVLGSIALFLFFTGHHLGWY
ncbi:MAG: hypothetical protein HYT14_00700 [Candidatus Liptonbacteria bacterium]|nr:hypothetical protein [Candidatus Liptonbacteria bacterium]